MDSGADPLACILAPRVQRRQVRCGMSEATLGQESGSFAHTTGKKRSQRSRNEQRPVLINDQLQPAGELLRSKFRAAPAFIFVRSKTSNRVLTKIKYYIISSQNFNSPKLQSIWFACIIQCPEMQPSESFKVLNKCKCFSCVPHSEQLDIIEYNAASATLNAEQIHQSRIDNVQVERELISCCDGAGHNSR